MSERNQPDRLSPQDRQHLVREIFEAVAAVGFHKWYGSESPQALQAAGYTREELQDRYTAVLEKQMWPQLQQRAARSSDTQLQNVLEEWVEKGNALGLLGWRQDREQAGSLWSAGPSAGGETGSPANDLLREVLAESAREMREPPGPSDRERTR